MSRLARFGPLFIALGLCLGFTGVFPSFLASYVIEPVAVSLWLVWRVVLSVDQNVYWALLLLVCGGCTVALLAFVGGEPPASVAPIPHVRETHVARWQALMHESARTEGGEQILRARLLSLLAAALGSAEQVDSAQLEKTLASQHIWLPGEIRQYLFPAPAAARRLPARIVWRLLFLAKRWLPGSASKQSIPNAATIDQVLRWMESMMEMGHEQQ
jgi:hypothetical protein